MTSNLVNTTKLTRMVNATAAATGDLTPGASIDMTGYQGVTFIVGFGTITATGVPSIKVQQSSDDGVGDAFSDLAGTLVQGADTDSDKCLQVDINEPTKRYVRPIIGRATANHVVDFVIAIQHGARKQPTTHDATTVAGSETHSGPAEGTA